MTSAGRGRGVKHFLSKRLYVALDDRGSYTRRRGLDRETNKTLLLKHITEYASEGSPLRDLCQVLPQVSYAQVRRLLSELQAERRAHMKGKTKGARWFP
jgi:ATP-dependent DNA helicase RecG